ncbi:hypothetical protein BJY01DRAFT_255011 [Aspergillus pseudoustus]|uniref:Myb-like domain-containing protein n=1 Tax=Aspergillus pseudoustus TaxID=1810923 RepID=A0ABR4INQ3_9EURO
MSITRSILLYRKRSRVPRWTEEEQGFFQTLLDQNPGIRDPWLFTELYKSQFPTRSQSAVHMKFLEKTIGYTPGMKTRGPAASLSAADCSDNITAGSTRLEVAVPSMSGRGHSRGAGSRGGLRRSARSRPAPSASAPRTSTLGRARRRHTLPRRQSSRREEVSRASVDERTAPVPDSNAESAANQENVDISSDRDDSDDELNQPHHRNTSRSLPTTPWAQQDQNPRLALQQSADRTPATEHRMTEAVDRAEHLSQYMQSVVKALKKNRDEFRQNTRILQAMQMSVDNLDTKELFGG